MKNLFPISIHQTLPFLALCLVAVIPAQAQQSTTPPADQDEINRQLQQQVQQLEDQVKQLREKQAAAAAAAAPEPAAEPPAVHEVAPRLQLNVFGDVGYQAGAGHVVGDRLVLGDRL